MKKFARFVGIVVVGLVVGLSMVSCVPPEDDGSGGNGTGGSGNGGGGGLNPTVTIKNNTGYLIRYSGIGGASDGGVWIKPSIFAQSWGSNFLGIASSIEDGTSRTFTLSQPLSTQRVYDIQIKSQNFNGSGYSFSKYGVTISNGMTITFTTSDLDDGSNLPTITIQNRSGKSFNSIHIKPTVVSDWGSSFGSLSNNSNLSATVLIPLSNYSVFDIQMRSTNPTNTYTRNNVTISNGMSLLFTSADADNPTIELPVIVALNNTGYLIRYSGIGGASDGGVWIKPSTSDNWGSNFLSIASSIEDGTSCTFTLSQPLSTQSVYDIRLKSQNFNGSGYNFTKFNVTVTEGMALTFTTSDLEQ